MAYLVVLPNRKSKHELQVWWFNPDKALRKNPYIIKKMEIDDTIAKELTLKQLELIYGSQLSDQF